MTLSTSFYFKVAGVCFVIGGCMELFMIKTGFYDVVTRNEAERWLENKAERDSRVKQFKEDLVEQFRSKGLDVPPALRDLVEK